MGWWTPWRGRTPRGRHALDGPCAPLGGDRQRLADGDTVPVPGYPGTWNQRIAHAALNEPTDAFPTVDKLVRPYLNAAEQAEGRHRGWWPA